MALGGTVGRGLTGAGAVTGRVDSTPWGPWSRQPPSPTAVAPSPRTMQQAPARKYRDRLRCLTAGSSSIVTRV
jgi:hypothetical protein